MGKSKIEWTYYTFNPWRGCQRVSAGCKNCYAETLSKRNQAVLGEWGPDGKRAMASESYWKLPIAWNRAAEKAGERRRVFCASLADVFEDRPELHEPRARLFSLIDKTLALDWLLLTKRPENILDLWSYWHGHEQYFPPNVWLGVSVEDQARADERIPILLRTPAAVRFVSVEPLLGPVDLGGLGLFKGHCRTHDFPSGFCHGPCPDDVRLDWVIVGGESGPNARPCNVEWIRDIVKQCREAEIPVFMKQLGSLCLDNNGTSRCSWPPETQFLHVSEGCKVRLKDKKGGDPSEWPEDLRIRESPL